MEIMELAATLGRMLREDERLKKLEVAKKEYEDCEELQQMLLEYDVQQKALQREITKDEKDTAFIDIIQNRIDQLYKGITEHEAFENLTKIQAEVNELMNAVNTTITVNITGEAPSGCTHNCATCGGCH